MNACPVPQSASGFTGSHRDGASPRQAHWREMRLFASPAAGPQAGDAIICVSQAGVSWDMRGCPGVSGCVLGYAGVSWCVRVCPGICGGVLVCPGVSWDMRGNPGVSGCVLGYAGVSWGVRVCPGVSWSPGNIMYTCQLYYNCQL